jgi:hypothetical protein
MARTSTTQIHILNGDGKPDRVVSNWLDTSQTHGVVGVLLGNGDGTFGSVVTDNSRTLFKLACSSD